MTKQDLIEKYKDFMSQYLNTTINQEYEIENFIFETIIPEVIKSITDIDYSKFDRASNCDNNYLLWIESIRQKAKDSYWIIL